MLKDHYLYAYYVLKRLRKAEIEANINKCKFCVQKTKFFNIIIFIEDTEIDLQKVGIILDWVKPTSICNIRLFLRFCKFY